jgi:lipopolysaccharide export system protein LptC
MDTNVILISIGALVAVLALYYYFYQKDKKNATEAPAAVQAPVPAGTSAATQQLQLQAYERLVILADRIAIPNLISRNNQAGLSKTDMQVLLTQTIKQEFDHNLSQQIYVSAEAWDAVRNLKEQNTHLINQVASILPSEASGLDLNKKLLEFVMNQPQGSLHNLVQDAISSDAKKLMK